MNADPCRVIVAVTDDSFPSPHRSYARHRGFPELWGNGDSLQEAAGHLADRLGHELDGGVEARGPRPRRRPRLRRPGELSPRPSKSWAPITDREATDACREA